MIITPQLMITKLYQVFYQTGKDEMYVYMNTKDGKFTVQIKAAFIEELFDVSGEEESVSLLVRELIALGFAKENLHWGFQLDKLNVSKVSYSC